MLSATRTPTPPPPPASALYVATTGNDANAGTFAAPFLTIAGALGSASCVPGTTVFVRGGTYAGILTINKSGTSSLPIIVRNYFGEAPILNGASGAADSDVVTIFGSYLQFSGFEVVNAKAHGIIAYQTQSVAIVGNTIHNCVKHGIWIGGDTLNASHDNSATDNVVYDTCRANLNGALSGGGWGQGIQANLAENIQIVGNTVYQNWGEGIGSYVSGGALIAHNTLHDNWSANIYLDNAPNTIVRDNFVYSTGLTAFYNGGAPHPSEGIAMAIETATPQRPLTAPIIVNNIVGPGNRYGIYYGNFDHGGGMQNAVIANNTVFKSTAANIHIETDAGHSGNVVKNNIFYQPSTGTNTDTAGTGATYDYNVWFNGSAGASAGAHDVTSDPLLVVSAANTYVATDYQLRSGSPAIAAGTQLSQVTDDFGGATRAIRPNMGAYEGAVSPTLSTADATWFDIQPSASVSAPNSAMQITLTPRLGTWPVSGTISLASNKAGTFGTLTVPNGTSTPVVTNYIPSVTGYHLITGTNTLGLKNPGYVGVSVFSPSTGFLCTISQSTTQLAAIKDASIWERDCRSGSMGSGWSASFKKGWARFDIPLTLSASSPGLWMRLYRVADLAMAIDPTASTTVGSGTLLQAPVQVSGSVPSGVSTVSLNIPAGMDYYYIEFATDAAFTTPYRIPKRIGGGQRIGMSARSFLCVLTWGWDYFGYTGLANYLTMAGNYGLASCYTSPPQSATLDWLINDGTPAANTSPGIMEICRLMSGALGVLTGIFGSSINGGSLDVRLTTLGQLNTLSLISAATNGLTKFSYFIFGERDTTMSAEQLSREFVAVTAWLETLSGSPVINSITQIDNYHSGQNMTQLGNGYCWAQKVASTVEQTRRNIVSASPVPGTQVNSHSGMVDRIVTGRGIARALLSREDPAFGGTGGPNGNPRGPRFDPTTTGTRLPGSYVLTIPVQHRGGSALVSVKAQFTGDRVPITITTPTSVEASGFFTVRLRGEFYGYGRKAAFLTNVWDPLYGVAVKMDATNPVTILNTAPGVSKIQIKLDSTTPGSVTFVDGSTMPLTDAQAFSVGYGSDGLIGVTQKGNINYNNTPGYALNGISTWVSDDNNPQNVQFGHDMQREVGYYIEAPTPAAQHVTMNPPASTPPSGWLELIGPPGTGTRLSGLQFSIDGAVKNNAAWSAFNDDNSWRAVLQSPSTIGTHSVAVYRTGQAVPDDTKSFGVQAPATLLGAGSDMAYMNLSSAASGGYLESYSAVNAIRHWTDTAATQHPSKELDVISRWDGDSGNIANRLGQYRRLSVDWGYPSMDFNTVANNITTYTTSLTKPAKSNQHLGVIFETQQGLYGPCNPIIANMLGDFTVVSAHRTSGFGNIIYPPWMLVNSLLGYLVGIYDSGHVGTIKRGANQKNLTIEFGFDNASSMSACVMRYRVSDGLLEMFIAPSNGTPWITTANTVTPETIAPVALLVAPYFGAMFSLAFFKSRFDGDLSTGDVNAALTHLTNRWG